MKALKIIFSVLLLISIIPCIIYLAMYSEAINNVCEAIANSKYGAIDYSPVYPALHRAHEWVSTLLLAITPLFVSGAVLGLTLKRKRFGSFIAVSFPIVALIWLIIATSMITSLRDHPLLALFQNVDGYTKALYSWALRKFVTFTIIPILGFLTVGTIEIIKRTPITNTAVLQESANVISTIPSFNTVSQPTSNIEELKQMKELLDMGVITQADFEAKKKQLLGLNTASSTPSIPVQTGKCAVCGRENLPVENVEILIAGTARKRTMCTECATKYK